MKYSKVFGLILGIALVLMTGCSTVPSALAVSGPGDSDLAAGNVVEVTAKHLEFEAPDEIPSGWTTLRLNNESERTHFAVLERLPEGIGVEDQQEEVAPVFQEGMDLLNAGEFEAALEKFGELPAWFGEIVFMGGPGLTAPGGSAETTVFLEPGTYMIECYVKTNGVFHSFNPDPEEFGMVHEFTVTEETSKVKEPKPSLELSISSTEGIQVRGGNLRPGEHTVAVTFEDQTVHENFLGHDVQLVRLEEDTDMDELVTWMDWTQPTGLETPAPATFLGGIQEMPAGETGYFRMILKPGTYAWISEVPNAPEKGMLQTFTVP
jgi:hypothetical protein